MLTETEIVFQTERKGPEFVYLYVLYMYVHIHT